MNVIGINSKDYSTSILHVELEQWNDDDERKRGMIATIRAAFRSAGFRWTQNQSFRVTNPETGSEVTPAWDHTLAVALQMLSRSDRGPVMALGQLDLSGRVRVARGTIGAIVAAKQAGIGRVIVPREQRRECGMVADGVEILAVDNLNEAFEAWLGVDTERFRVPYVPLNPPKHDLVMSDVTGCEDSKARIADAVERKQSVLMLGPYGSGRTMLARRVNSVQPDLSPELALEVAQVQSAAGLQVSGTRPFRAPHHTVSARAFESEICLARHGVLYLDEATEFRPSMIDHVLAYPPKDVFVIASATRPRDPNSSINSYIDKLAARFDVVLEQSRT